MAWALTILCLVFMGASLWAEHTQAPVFRYLCKPIASLAFVVLAALAQVPPSSYGLWILAGLVLGAVGDVALMSRSSRSFLVGLVSFLLGHLAYVVAFAWLVSPAQWFVPLALAPVAAALAVLAYLWRYLGSMRGAVIAYVGAIVLMVVGAMAVYAASPESLPEAPARLVVIGALLFFASDVSVAKARFVRARLVDRLWGLPAYYLGQLCLAWSLY